MLGFDMKEMLDAINTQKVEPEAKVVEIKAIINEFLDSVEEEKVKSVLVDPLRDLICSSVANKLSSENKFNLMDMIPDYAEGRNDLEKERDRDVGRTKIKPVLGYPKHQVTRSIDSVLKTRFDMLDLLMEFRCSLETYIIEEEKTISAKPPEIPEEVKFKDYKLHIKVWVDELEDLYEERDKAIAEKEALENTGE